MTLTPAQDIHPPGRSRGGAERWVTIRFALDSWSRTLRLCLILLVASVQPFVLYLGLSWLVHR
jgi:hypothetical protein